MFLDSEGNSEGKQATEDDQAQRRYTDTERNAKKARNDASLDLTMLSPMTTMLSPMTTLGVLSMQKRLIQVDPSTGEVVDGFVAYVAPKRVNGFREGWIAMAQGPLIELAKSELEGADLKVLLMLLAKLDFENLLVVSQAEIAQKLGTDRANVNRSIKRLIGLGVLLEGPRIGIHRSYRLNPNFGWKGSASNHHKAIGMHMRERMKKANIHDVIDGGSRQQ